MGMKTVAIIGALDEEVALIAKSLTHVTHTAKGSLDIVSGTVDSFGSDVIKVAATVGGMGLVNAAATTQLLIDEIAPDAVIFSGIAGNMTSKIGIGDVCVGETVVYHDAELSMIAQSAPFQTEYHGDPALVQTALDACEACGVKAIAGKIATGDTFVGDAATKKTIEKKCHPDCVEMEGAAVSQIAGRNGVPCVILRAMSDNADESGYEVLVVKQFSITEYVKTATEIVTRMIESV